jgi:FkbM family methyltransferase
VVVIKMSQIIGENSRSNDRRGEFIELSGVKIFANLDKYSETIIKYIKNGGYESGERQVIPKILERGDRVIEIGSAIGCVSMVAAKIVGQENILAFEANPALIDDAQSNYLANGFSIVSKNAILQNRVNWSGKGRSVDFFINADFWASSTARTAGTVETVSVPTLCFEEEAELFCANTLICDIEGGEIELLELADLTNFDKILLEVHYWAGRKEINRLMRKLIIDGFSINFDASFGSIVSLHRGLSPPIRCK